MMDRIKTHIALQNAYEYIIGMSFAPAREKPVYERHVKRCLKAAAEHAGFRVFEANDTEQDKAA